MIVLYTDEQGRKVCECTCGRQYTAKQKKGQIHLKQHCSRRCMKIAVRKVFDMDKDSFARKLKLRMFLKEQRKLGRMNKI